MGTLQNVSQKKLGLGTEFTRKPSTVSQDIKQTERGNPLEITITVEKST